MDSFDDSFDTAPFDALPVQEPAPLAPEPTPIRSPLATPIAPYAHYPTAARARAGLGLVAAAAGAGVGGAILGPAGAAMGLVGVGALRNLYRSQHLASDDPSLRADAARGLALGVVGVGVVGYLAYRIFWKGKD